MEGGAARRRRRPPPEAAKILGYTPFSREFPPVFSCARIHALSKWLSPAYLGTLSWAASGGDLWEGGREREKGERKGERKREGGRSVNILVHSCSDATSRELRRIPHVCELPGYARDALGGLFRVSECLYK